VTVPQTEPMPAVFIGHGSPMNTLEQNRWTETWAEFGRSIPRPTAILAVSAHWFINATAVTVMDRPKTIHDFFGFPQELFDYQYSAPGAPELAEQVIELVKPTWIGRDVDSWGLDHGTWSVLAHMFPSADIPVIQLSLDATKPADYHVELGAALDPLRQQGVLILGSGNVVHNLGAMSIGADPTDWNIAYDTAGKALMTERPGDIVELVDHQAHPLAAPTPDHLLPLFYVAGAAKAAGSTAEVLNDGYLAGTLSMTSYVVPAAA
jgi:4,5-DOPA dioxygenase extradiol